MGPRWKLWRLMWPAKPLPLETPVTSTRSPSANRSPSATVWPTLVAVDAVDPELADRAGLGDLGQVLELAGLGLGQLLGRARCRAGRPCSRRGPAVRRRVTVFGSMATTRDGDHRAVGLEHLGHADLAADQSDAHGRHHILISMSTPAARRESHQGVDRLRARDPGCRRAACGCGSRTAPGCPCR